MDLCRIFSSATRAPFVLAYESANLDEAERPWGGLTGHRDSDRFLPPEKIDASEDVVVCGRPSEDVV